MVLKKKIKGLKTNEGQRFEKFFSIVQTAANKRNCIFFLEAGDGRDFTDADMDGEDLMGWLIPYEKADEFEQLWLKNESNEEWDEFFCFAVWEFENSLIIKFTI